nr:MAG TPA: hypothetical protein [Caudoviricetes sp.]
MFHILMSFTCIFPCCFVLLRKKVVRTCGSAAFN